MLDFSQILSTTLSAVQAAVSVILVLLYGYAARKYNLLSEEGEANMSHLSVTIFLPCLLFSEIGPLASWSNLKEYWIIIVYSLLFQGISWLVGTLGVMMGMPQWLVPCMVFNNATSLPLLLLDSLGKNGTLKPLAGKDDMGSVISRGKVYLLINALVGNLTRFSFGPSMMKQGQSHSWSHSESPHALKNELKNAVNNGDHDEPSEDTPLLDGVAQESKKGWKVVKVLGKHLGGFMNPPMYGGLAAVLAGLIPFLHRWLFEQGWLGPFAESIENLGGLYAVLQMFVLGAHLRSKKGTRPPIWPLVYLFVFRFAIMPVISTAVVWGVRKGLRDHILSDPVLDFVMMIAPVGPPALTLAAIVEMSDAGESTETAVAQTIVLSYILTPLISGSVTAALSVVQSMYSSSG